MTVGDVGGAVLTAALTILGGVLLFFLKGLKEESAERRSFRRTLHDEAVGTVADIDILMGCVRYLVVFRDSPPGINIATYLSSWTSGPGRALRRLVHGHTDPAVRRAALELTGHLSLVMATADATLRVCAVNGPRPSKREADEMFDMFQAADAAFRILRNAVLGEDSDPNEPTTSTAADRFWREQDASARTERAVDDRGRAQ